MWDRLELIGKRFQELSELLAQPEMAADLRRLQELSREKASLEDVVRLYRKYQANTSELAESRALLEADDTEAEMLNLIKEEV